jgi:Cu/Ag efflux protein CusF
MKRHPAWLATGLLILAVLACKNSGSDSKPIDVNHKTSEIHMAKDDGTEMPGKATTTFSVKDRTIHCESTLNEAKEGTKVSFGWSVVEVKGSPAQKIKDLDYTTKAKEDIVHSHLTAPQDWPMGKYKCEVTIDGTLDRTVDFTIE